MKCRPKIKLLPDARRVIMKFYSRPEMKITFISLQNAIAVSNIPTLTNGGEDGVAQSESYASMFGE